MSEFWVFFGIYFLATGQNKEIYQVVIYVNSLELHWKSPYSVQIHEKKHRLGLCPLTQITIRKFAGNCSGKTLWLDNIHAVKGNMILPNMDNVGGNVVVVVVVISTSSAGCPSHEPSKNDTSSKPISPT